MKIKKDKLMLFLEFLFLIVLAITHILSFSYLNIVPMLLILFLFLISDINLTIKMLFIALPFFNLLNLNIGTTSFYYLYIIVFIIKYLIFKKFRLEKHKLLFLLVLLLVRIPSEDFSALIRWLLLISVLFFTYNEDYFKKNIKEIVMLLSFSFIISSFFGYYMLLHGLSIYTGGYVYTKELGATTRFAGLIGDPVFFSQFSSFLILLCLIINYYSKRFNFLRYILIIVLLIFTLLTYSKMGILLSITSILIYVILLILKNASSKKTAIKSVIITLFFFIVVCFLVKYIISNSSNYIIKNYYTRFTSGDLFTGRRQINEYYINLLKSSWKTLFISMPYSDYTSYFPIGNGHLLNRAHNIYLESVCIFGLLVTIIIFFWLIRKIYIMLKQKQKKSIIYILPIMLLLISGLTLHGHLEFHYYYLVALSFAFLDIDMEINI